MRVPVLALLLSASAVAAPLRDVDFGKLPLAFEVNRGQAPPYAHYLARGAGFQVALGPYGATLALGNDRDIIGMRLVGAQAASSRGQKPLPTKMSYIFGSDPAKWQSGIPTFAEVRFERVYPGIDIVYYGNGRRLEYDFVVAPGADPRRIALLFDGATPRLADGEITLSGAEGLLTLRRPRVYQGTREVNGRFQLDGKLVRFVVDEYDRARPLVIDPIVEYSTFLGGTDDDIATAVAVDSNGSAVVVGGTKSANFPILPPFSGSGASGEKVFVAKLSPNGEQLLFANLIGGNNADRAKAVTLDGSGNIYVGGYTTSTNFPLLNPAQTGSGTQDGFVLKVGPNGGTLLLSTLLGGSDAGADEIRSIAIGPTGNIFAAGVLGAATTFVDIQGVGGTKGTGNEAFVAGLNPLGGSFLFRFAFGGSDPEDAANKVIADGTNLWVVGQASGGLPFLASPNSFKTSPNGMDCFVLKLAIAAVNGTPSVAYSTYLGGTGDDRCAAAALTTTGQLFVAGQSTSTLATFPAPTPTPSPSSSPLNPSDNQGLKDGFLARIDPSANKGLQANLWTFFGGTNDDMITSMALLGDFLYIGASTKSAMSNISPDALQEETGTGKTGFLVRVDTSDFNSAYSSYFGGSNIGSATLLAEEGVAGIAVDNEGSAYLVGTATDTFQVPSVHAVQPVHANLTLGPGTRDAFVSKVRFTPRPLFAKPTLGALSPSNGPTSGGTNVVLTGDNFHPGASVTFGGAPAPNVQVVNSTTIVATTPPHPASAPNGGETVIVTNADGQSSAGGIGFRFDLVGLPAVTGITPSNGSSAGGTAVTITGVNFGGTPSVKFGGTDATSIALVSPTILLATTPSHAAGLVDVVVSLDGAAVTGTQSFIYTDAPSSAPTIGVVTPNLGPIGGGTRVILLGNNFVSGMTVNFDGAGATDVDVINSNTIACTTPAHAAGTVTVQVIVPGGLTAQLADGFTYAGQGMSGQLQLVAVVPNRGGVAGGDSVLVVGSGFGPSTSVSFGGTAAGSVTLVDSTLLRVVTPPHAKGTVDVSAMSSTETSSIANAFSYEEPVTASGGGCSIATGADDQRSWLVHDNGLALLALVFVALMLRRRRFV